MLRGLSVLCSEPSLLQAEKIIHRYKFPHQLIQCHPPLSTFKMAEEIKPDKQLSPLKLVPFCSFLLPKIHGANGYLVRHVVLIQAYRCPCKETFLLRKKSLMMVLVFTVGFSFQELWTPSKQC